MEENKKELYIPTNIPESRARDFFSGYGYKELYITIGSFVAGIIIAVLLYCYTAQILFSLIIAAGLVGITILIVKRDKYDESMIDQAKILWKFHKAQKQYEYEYCNIYESQVEEWQKKRS